MTPAPRQGAMATAGLPDRRIMLVNRVASVAEALLVRRAGATLVGVALAPDIRFADQRCVLFEQARAIRDAIGPAYLVATVPLQEEQRDFHRLVDHALALRPAWLQVHHRNAGADLAEWVREDVPDLPVLVDGLWLDEDYGTFTPPDDPGQFFRESYETFVAARADLATLDLYGEGPDLWRYLSVLAPQEPERFRGGLLQVGHVQAATREKPLLLDLAHVHPRDARAYVAAFPDARGFFVRLGPDQASSAAIGPARLLAVLDALRG